MAAGTISLCVITKKFDDYLVEKLAEYGRFFDKVYVQVNGSTKDYKAFRKEAGDYEGASDTVALPRRHDVRVKVELSYRPWDKSFGAARNAVLDQVDTDFFMWLDTDDEVTGLDRLRDIVRDMVNDEIDVVDLPYEYAYNELGEVITLQYRERIIRVRKDLRWHGRVHETVLSETPVSRVRYESIVIKHQKTEAEHAGSSERNHELLLLDWDETKDPRTAHYLGLSYYARKEYEEAIAFFQEHIKTSGWPEEQYRSWIYIAQCHKFLGSYYRAQRSLNEAIELLPTYPDAYFYKGDFYNEEAKFDEAIFWITEGRNRPIPTNTLSAMDTTLYTYKPLITGALALLNLGKIEEAYAWYSAAKKLSPNNELITQFGPLFEETYGESEATKRAIWLMRYLAAVGGRPLDILKAFPPQIANSVKFNPSRAKYLPKKVWSDRSIVIFSGVAPEPWGPDFMEHGVGGSEEAVINLSRELQNLGWEVTVFCDRETELTTPEGVQWKPWTLLNPYDSFNVYVAWRNPFLASGIKAKKVLCDVHDVIPEAQVYNSLEFIDTYMVKTNYHRSLYPDAPDSKFAIAGNGINKSHFTPVKKRKHSVGYFSSYNRGLECLLDMWPSIRKEVPDATLDIYYGWDVFDKVANTEQKQWKAKMLIKLGRLKKDGVTEHGRVSHEELAKRMGEIAVWAYPTEFTEIHCITALKAQEAGCIPVTTNVAALDETVQSGIKLDWSDIYGNDEAQEAFVASVVASLNVIGYLHSPVPNCDWQDVAHQWNEVIK